MSENKKRKRNVSRGDLVDQNIAAWCIERGYKIYPLPAPECKGKVSCDKYTLVIERFGKKKMGKQEYTYIECQNKIWELYNLIYSKKNENKKG